MLESQVTKPQKKSHVKRITGEREQVCKKIAT